MAPSFSQWDQPKIHHSRQIIYTKLLFETPQGQSKSPPPTQPCTGPGGSPAKNLTIEGHFSKKIHILGPLPRTPREGRSNPWPTSAHPRGSELKESDLHVTTFTHFATRKKTHPRAYVSTHKETHTQTYREEIPARSRHSTKSYFCRRQASARALWPSSSSSSICLATCHSLAGRAAPPPACPSAPLCTTQAKQSNPTHGTNGTQHKNA